MSNAVPWSTLRADHGQADRDVDALVEPEHLDRAVALVVVHRDDEVEVAADGAEERGVGRQRALGVDAVGRRGRDGGLDLLRLLAAPEQAVLARVRVDAADRDPRRLDAAVPERLVAAAGSRARRAPGSIASTASISPMWVVTWITRSFGVVSIIA